MMVRQRKISAAIASAMLLDQIDVANSDSVIAGVPSDAGKGSVSSPRCDAAEVRLVGAGRRSRSRF
jgi:hypothetical protein